MAPRAQKKFEIVLAETAGFCMGVRRAVRRVLDATDDPRSRRPIRTHGPLIHNRQVLQVLRRRGVTALEEGEPENGGTIVIRAHGLPLEEQKRLRADWPHLLDATCPHVARVQDIVEEYSGKGYLCVVVGDRGHAEVESVLSYADGAGHVVSGPAGVKDLPEAEKVAVVAQTTQDEQVFRATVRQVEARYGVCEAFDTICRSTGLRQQEVRQLAGEVDAMVVVGGLHSANTRRLAEISRAAGAPTYHVETEQELPIGELLSHGRVGLTAGASTPNWMIKRVIRHLENEHRRRTNPVSYRARMFWRALVDADVYAAGGAAALTFAAAQLLPASPPTLGLCMAVAFLFVLAQHLINQYMRRGTLYLRQPSRADFFLANERKLLGLALGSAALAVLLSVLLGPLGLGLVLFGTAAGIVYQVRLPRPLALRLGVGSLEQLPGSKELFVSLAYATLGAVIPALEAGVGAARWPAVALVFGVCFVLAFQRTLALDIREVESDQLVGAETLTGALGARAAQLLYFALSGVLAALLTAGALGGRLPPLAYLLLASVPYGVACYLMVKRRRPEGEFAEGLVDGQLFLTGLLAMVWVLISSPG
ncbi:MAG: 4-hydroxy-3-methylbut-2-enyl diphosphate reductase [Planctomycetota bacterium]